MNKKECGELRRRMTYERNSITALRGCFVSGRREIISCFDCSLALMPEDEAEMYLALLRKVFSGRPGVTSNDIAFSAHDVSDSPLHKLLCDLRSTGLRDDELVKTYYRHVIESLDIDGDCLILLAHDSYDMPTRSKDGADSGDSERVFSYIVSCVCPVKDTKSNLAYTPDDGAFHSGRVDRAVGMPELGFVFPAFDDRAANIYGALYYTRDAGENHPDFVEAVFGTPVPQTATSQRESFGAVLSESISDVCSYDVMENVRRQLSVMVDEHEADKSETEPLTVSKRTMKALLEASGVDSERVAEFGVKFDEQFGEGASVMPQNIVELKKLELVTPEVSIKVANDRGDLVETRVIDGVKYIMIRADGGVELNGVELSIAEEPATDAAEEKTNEADN